MYEYDTYADARRTIPRLREPLQTLDGEYHLIKIDPLAGTMSFSTSKNTIANLTTLTTERVKAIIAMNRAGEKPESLIGDENESPTVEPTYRSEEDSIDRFDNKGRRNKRNKRNRGRVKPAVAEDAEPKSEGEQKQPREPKENREPREPRENSENREPREQRENREPRERGERRGRYDRGRRRPRHEGADNGGNNGENR
jgi:hypothetical protein